MIIIIKTTNDAFGNISMKRLTKLCTGMITIFPFDGVDSTLILFPGRSQYNYRANQLINMFLLTELLIL